MLGLITRLAAQPGRRADLVAAMTSETGGLPGCRHFAVAADPGDPDAVWITEIWDSRAAWEASFDIPGVKASMQVALPLIRAMDSQVETQPLAILDL